MSLGPDGGVGVGLGYAAVLVQLHLGIGLLLLALAPAASSVPALRGARWQAGLRAAAAAAGPAPLLAVFALIQASAAPPDLLAWAGLLASSSAVVLGPLHVALCGGLGLELPAVDARSGSLGAVPGGGAQAGAAWRLAALARVLNSLRAFGQALLLLASPPAGAQLLCASALLRLQLGAHALSAAASALAPPLGGGGAPAGLLRDAAIAAGAAPLVGSLALVDATIFGPSSLLLAPLNPTLHCAIAVLAQVGLAAVVRTSLGGSAEASERAEFDFHLKLGAGKADGDAVHVVRLRRLAVAGLHAAMAIGAARIVAGTMSVDASMSGFSVQWGEPPLAAASLLTALLVATHAAEFCLARASGAAPPGPSVAHMNGCGAPGGDANGCGAPGGAAAEAAPEAPGSASGVKAAVAPAHSLVLALLVVHLQGLESGDFGAPGSVVALAALPFQYGLVLAAAAVGAQAAALAVLPPSQGGEPPLDGAGAAAGLRQAAALCLQAGLLAGWAGMGVRLWAVLGLTMGPVAYLILPAEAREELRIVAGAVGGRVMEAAEHLASIMQAYVKQRQYEKDVLHARKADEMAAEVERELGTAPGEARGGKAPKGLKAKAAAPAEVKATKAKSASKPRRR